MRSRIVLLATVLTACGGKTMLFDEGDAGAGAATVQPKPEPKPEPKRGPEPERDCARPVPWTNDFGALDVSRFGCECTQHDDCARGEVCMTFPSIETAHCVPTDDPCSVVQCRGTATCVVGDADPMIPQCYR